MVVIWQGYGYIALAVATLPLLGCVGLLDFHPQVGLFAGGVGFLAASAVCFWSNRALRRAAARRVAEAADDADPDAAYRAAEAEPSHTLYFLPLSAWVWIYGAFGMFFAGAAGLNIVLKGLKN